MSIEQLNLRLKSSLRLPFLKIFYQPVVALENVTTDKPFTLLILLMLACIGAIDYFLFSGPFFHHTWFQTWAEKWPAFPKPFLIGCVYFAALLFTLLKSFAWSIMLVLIGKSFDAHATVSEALVGTLFISIVIIPLALVLMKIPYGLYAVVLFASILYVSLSQAIFDFWLLPAIMTYVFSVVLFTIFYFGIIFILLISGIYVVHHNPSYREKILNHPQIQTYLKSLSLAAPKK